MAVQKDYYLARPHYSLSGLKDRFLALYRKWETEGWFNELLGSRCVSKGKDRPGVAGDDIAAFFDSRTRRRGLWPVADRLPMYTETELFAVIELLHEHIAILSVLDREHDKCECGGCLVYFDADGGRREFRHAVNDCLRHYGLGYVLLERGEVVPLPDAELPILLDAAIPSHPDKWVNERIANAKARFRKPGAPLEDRLAALKELADVLEAIRDDCKRLLDSSDEGELFKIANTFAIRHLRSGEKKDYDRDIWYTWIFCAYLSTIQLVLRLLDRERGARDGTRQQTCTSARTEGDTP